MNKKVTIILISLISIIGAGIYLLLNQDLVKSFSENSLNFVEDSFEKTVNNGGNPIRKQTDDEGSRLSVKGAIAETNRHRAEADLPPLTENTLLDIAAQKKVDDMFERQYFEHESPTGEGAGDLVEEAGYEYIVVGENLALGNYKDDTVLLRAWMDSPGHRENILKSSYTEIGIAVARGKFEGRDTWLAVQHFGKPQSACPAINNELKDRLNRRSAQAEELQADLERRKQEIEDSDDPKTQEEADEYNKKVDDYNAKVREYNNLINEMKSMSEEYNSQVRAYNECAKS